MVYLTFQPISSLLSSPSSPILRAGITALVARRMRQRHSHGSKETTTASGETEREYNEMKAAIDYDRQHGLSNWKNLFTTKASRYRTYVALFSQFIWAW